MCYPCSENKGADQLCGYRKADLRLCFLICKKGFSHDAAQFIMTKIKKTDDFNTKYVALPLTGIFFLSLFRMCLVPVCLGKIHVFTQFFQDKLANLEVLSHIGSFLSKLEKYIISGIGKESHKRICLFRHIGRNIHVL